VKERDSALLLLGLDRDAVRTEMFRRRSEMLLSANRITIGCAVIVAGVDRCRGCGMDLKLCLECVLGDGFRHRKMVTS